MPPEVRGPGLAAATCARRLAALGLDGDDVGAGLDVELTWFGGASGPMPTSGSEATVQALSGLMQVHGRDTGRPRRLGLEVASVAAGILAAQAVVAAAIGRRRGRTVAAVESSVLRAALLLVSHRVAAGTSGREWVPALPGPAPGPPFRSADGVWFEIETLDPEAWKGFWTRLGADPSTLGWGWKLFRSRFFRGTSTLPRGLHEAVARHPLAGVAAVADAHAVSLVRVRGYPEVLADLGCWGGHPLLTPLDEADGRPLDRAGGAGHDGPPLAGITVVEATSRLQGPLAGLLLRWLGAEVVRVEPPGGDPARAVAPLAGDTGTFFLCFNRGKRSVELDLAHPQGRAGLRELVAGADAFVQNWRPGKAAEWALDAADLGRVNPGLVYAEATGWGPDRPPGGGGRSDLVGTDYLVQAHAGVAAGVTPEGRPPMPSRALLSDYLGALVAAEGVLAGLYRREADGRGCRVQTSLLAGAMSLQAHVLEDLAAGRERGRRDGRPRWGHLDHPLDAADRLVAVSIDDDAGLRRLCRACGVDPAHDGAPDLVADRIAARPAADWEDVLGAEGIPCAAVCTDLAALAADPRLSGLFERLAGPSHAPTAPWRLVTAGPPETVATTGADRR